MFGFGWLTFDSFRLAEFLPVAAGQVPDVPGVEQRRPALDAAHRQHQLRREGGVVAGRQAAAGSAAAQWSHVADGLQRNGTGPCQEQQPRRSAASPPQEPLGSRRMERTLVGALLGMGLSLGARQGALVRPRPQWRRILVLSSSKRKNVKSLMFVLYVNEWDGLLITGCLSRTFPSNLHTWTWFISGRTIGWTSQRFIPRNLGELFWLDEDGEPDTTPEEAHITWVCNIFWWGLLYSRGMAGEGAASLGLYRI